MLQPSSGLGNPASSPVRKPKANVYTVMLVLALLAIIMGCVFLYLEIQEYQGKINLPPVQVRGPAAAEAERWLACQTSANRQPTLPCGWL